MAEMTDLYMQNFMKKLFGRQPDGTPFTSATRPTASIGWECRMILVKDDDGPAMIQICLPGVTGYGWATIQTGPLT